jgi:hypothetical protein
VTEIAAGMRPPFFVHVHEPEYSAAAVLEQHFNRALVTPVDLGLREFRSYRVSRFEPPGPVALPAAAAGLPPASARAPGWCWSTYTPASETPSMMDGFIHRGSSAVQRLRLLLRQPGSLSRRFAESGRRQTRGGAITVATAYLDNGAPTQATVRVEAEDEVLVVINDRPVIESLGAKPRTAYAVDVLLPGGPSTLTIAHHAVSPAGWVEISSTDGAGAPIPWACSRTER